MKIIITNIFFLFMLFLVRTCNAQKNNSSKGLETGRYGNISIVVKKDSIFGVFQYYDHWKEEFNDYESKNDFYFYGSCKELNDTIKLILTNPYEKETFGDVGNAMIIFKNDTLNYFQTGLKGMFQPTFFPDKLNKKQRGYRSTLTEKNKWKEIRFVKSSKTYFYNLPNTGKRKAYLLRNDLVWIIEKKEGWCLSEYYKFDSKKPVIIGWIKESDLYPISAKMW